MTVISEIQLMTRALELARKGKARTLPNPMVGAVLFKNGIVIAEGFHCGPGHPHAETDAIRKAGKAARGATLYVNLEPCCHTGRTGPCTDEIKKAGIKRVVYAAKDPNPLVNGKGARKLRQLGIEVANGLMSKEAARLNDVYFGLVKNNRPFVTLKIAQSLDGRIATSSGDSRWISGKEARKFVHQIRNEVDAVLVGAGTVRKDNPKLTTRLVKGKNPYRIIVTDSMNLPKNSHLLNDNKDRKTIVATSGKPMTCHGLTYWNTKGNDLGKIDIKDVLSKARAFGINSILIEGGAEMATSFLKEKFVDKLILITAPIVIGQGKEAVGDLGIDKLDKALTFNDSYRIKMGHDEVFIGYPDWSK